MEGSDGDLIEGAWKKIKKCEMGRIAPSHNNSKMHETPVKGVTDMVLGDLGIILANESNAGSVKPEEVGDMV